MSNQSIKSVDSEYVCNVGVYGNIFVKFVLT